LYGWPDLQVCVHECRAIAEDELFVATLAPTRTLTFLDLTEVLQEDGVTEFESLDLAIHMLFLAGLISRSLDLNFQRRRLHETTTWQKRGRNVSLAHHHWANRAGIDHRGLRRRLGYALHEG